MRIEIIDKSKGIKDLKTAVCYSISGAKKSSILGKNIKPTSRDLNNYSSNYAMYLGNSGQLSNNDFVQYNFSYYIDKYKFKDGLLINQLDKESRNLLGLDTTVLTAMEDRLCPSSIEDNTVPEFDYFGSSIFEKQKFISLDLKENIYKIEFYDDTIQSNHNLDNGIKFYEYGIFDKIDDQTDLSYTNIPILVVTLGPGEGDSTLDPISYRKLEEEIIFKKTLNIYLPNDLTLLDRELPPINITLDAWEADNKNPNRNSYKHILRNNEFYGMINKINPIEQLKHNLVYDVNSMTIVGKSKLYRVEDCPILDGKFKNISNSWSPDVRYEKGDEVSVDNITWVSLISNNIGNTPQLSSVWEEKEKLTDYYTNNLKIFFDETKYKNMGIIKPGNSVIITESTDYLEINIVPSLGFDINPNLIGIYPAYNNSNELPITYEDSEGNILHNYYHYITQDLGYIFVFKKESNNVFKLLKDLDCLYIKANPKQFNVYFNVLIDDTIKSSWRDWEEKDNTGLNINGETLYFDHVIASTRDLLRIEFEKSDLYKLTGLRTEYGNEIQAEDGVINNIQVIPTLERENANNSIIYTLLVNSLLLSLNVVEFSGFIVDNISQKLKSGSTGKLRFYIDEEYDNKVFTKVEINNGIVVLTTENPNTESFGGISLNKGDDGIYTLDFKNITENLDIKVL